MKSKKFTPMQSRILGIDPGYGRLGIAVIESNDRKLKLIHSECFETSNKLSHSMRLGFILRKFRKVVIKFKPDKLGIETLIFSKNVKTALKVAEVRGAIIAEAATKGIEISEYHPNSIKIAVTGYGKSEKKQIIFMIEKILQLKNKFKYDDEYDAIAVALTCGASKSFPQLA
jgi:crossover junction endodeoxyribonuclease RuvC